MSGSFDFGYSFPEVTGDVATGLMGILTGLLLVFLLMMMAFAVVTYVLSAVSAYRIARRRGIHHAWLAWVPMGNYWLLGSISDQYQYVVKRKVTNRRRILLILGIVTFTMSIVYSALQASTVLAFNVDSGMGNEIGMVAVGVLVYLVWIAAVITTTVFGYIAYFDLFRSCKPGSAVVFLVLSIVFSVTMPFFMIACSNSDEGMPPKRAQQPPVQIPYVEETPADAPVYRQTPVAEESVPVVETEIVEDTE